MELAVQVRSTRALPAVARRFEGAPGGGASGRAEATFDGALSGLPFAPIVTTRYS